MKICLINNLYTPYNRGGAETVVAQQIHDFLEQDHTVVLITTQPYTGYNVLHPQPDLTIHRFYPLNIFSFYSLGRYPVLLRALWRIFDIFNLHACYKVYRILKEERPDIVYAHNLTGLGYLIPRLIKRLKIQYTQIMHDVALVRPSGLLLFNSSSHNFFITLYLSLNRFLFNSPDKVLFPSVWLKKYYSSYNFFKHSQINVTPNFKFNHTDLLKNKKIKKPPIINFLYLGQVEEHKGILFLINVFNKFNDSNYTLNIVGHGKAQAKAKKIAEHNPHIIFHGSQPHIELGKFFSSADYLILPSLCYENSPTVIFESLSFFVPVIASNLGGVPELIQNNKNGYLFTAANPDSLINILKKCYNNIK